MNIRVIFFILAVSILSAYPAFAGELTSSDHVTTFSAEDIKSWPHKNFDGKQVIVSPYITTDMDEMQRHRLTINFTGSGKVFASIIHSPSPSLSYALEKKHLRGKLYELASGQERHFRSYYHSEKYAWITIHTEGDVDIKSVKHICFHGKNTLYGHIPLEYEYDGMKLPYRLLLPKNYNPAEDKKYPLVLSIGGSGSTGNDNVKNMEMVILGMYLFTKYYDDPSMACFSLVPQIPDPGMIKAPYYPKGPKGAPTQFHPDWPTVNAESWYTQSTISLIKTLAADPRLKIDTDRIYLTGFSYGGKACWEFMKAAPDLFAATICGAGWPIGAAYKMPDREAVKILEKEVQVYKHIPISIFAGEKDPMKLPSKVVYELLKREGADCSFTEIPGVSHVSSASGIWGISKNVRWLFEQKKTELKQ